MLFLLRDWVSNQQSSTYQASAQPLHLPGDSHWKRHCDDAKTEHNNKPRIAYNKYFIGIMGLPKYCGACKMSIRAASLIFGDIQLYIYPLFQQ